MDIFIRITSSKDKLILTVPELNPSYPTNYVTYLTIHDRQNAKEKINVAEHARGYSDELVAYLCLC